MMPDDIQYVFRSSALHYLWPVMEKVFTESEVKTMVAQMWKDKALNSPKEGDSNFILRYGLEVWQPMLNKKLNRPEDYPTWENMLRVAFKTDLERTKHLWKG